MHLSNAGVSKLKNTLDVYNALAGKESETLAGYLKYVVCDSAHPKRLALIQEPWQRPIYKLLTNLFEGATGVKESDARAAWIVAGRGHSKTSTLAEFLNWALCYSPRELSIVGAAADRDQAKILVERMRREAIHNPWLQLNFRNYEVSGPRGKMEVLSSDAPTSAGKLTDILVIDEITEHKNRALFDMLVSGRSKRRHGILVVIGTAGFQNTWQHELWKVANTSPQWITHTVPAMSASWLDKTAIEEDRKLLLPAVFKRLHLNEWVDLTEDSGYLTREQILACQDSEAKKPYQEGKRYIAAIDYGIVYDRAVGVVLHAEGDQVYLDEMQVWQGSPANRMQITTIEAWLDSMIRQYRVKKLIADPFQLEQLCQRYERRLEVDRFNFNGSTHYLMGDTLRSLVLNKRLHLYPDAGVLILADGTKETLIDELAALIVEDKGGGRWRVNHQDSGHDDRYCALAMGCLKAVRTKTSNFTQLLTALTKSEFFGEDIMYKEIKHIDVYATYQAVPVLNGEAVKLSDYPTMHEAAFAVNCAHEIAGSTPPNVVDAKKHPNEARQKEIREDVAKRLAGVSVAPPPPEPVKKTKAKASV